MRVRIRNLQMIEGEMVNGKRVVARFTAYMDHFRLYDLKLMDCPERGLTIWATRFVRLSMEGRAAILEKVLEKVGGGNET